MKKITIAGHMHDFIVVDGDLMAEGSPRYMKPGYVVLDTGDVFEVEYDLGGIWRVRWPVASGVVRLVHRHVVRADPPHEESTERLTVEGPFESLRVWQSWPVDDCELRDVLEEAMERAPINLFPRKQLITAIEALLAEPLVTE